MPINSSRSVKILTDDVEIKPGKDFERLSDTIVSFIRGSDPKFTVGIYGDWGTGKTTLMKSVERKITRINPHNDSIKTIWFNAWRYEREEQLATIALLKTLAFGLAGHEKFDKISSTIWNGLKIVGKDLLKQFLTQTLITEEAWDDIQTKLTEKMKLLQQFDQETIYFDGLKLIESEMEKIRNKDSDSRIIVFIDDLDRCSPKKVLEILESIKIFLDIHGFVFILGLSDRTVIRLISKEYEESGVGGDEYIQKIIQVPIRISEWHISDIEEIIEKKIIKKIDKKYADFILENKNLIANAIKLNPRELKRFVNNIILSSEVFSEQIENKEIKAITLLVIEAIKSRWPEFYSEFMLESDFQKEIIECLENESFIPEVLIPLRKENDEQLTDLDKKILSMDSDLWTFLFNDKVNKAIIEVENWEPYRKISESTTKPPLSLLNEYLRADRFIDEYRHLHDNHPYEFFKLVQEHKFDLTVIDDLTNAVKDYSTHTDKIYPRMPRMPRDYISSRLPLDLINAIDKDRFKRCELKLRRDLDVLSKTKNTKYRKNSKNPG